MILQPYLAGLVDGLQLSCVIASGATGEVAVVTGALVAMGRNQVTRVAAARRAGRKPNLAWTDSVVRRAQGEEDGHR